MNIEFTKQELELVYALTTHNTRYHTPDVKSKFEPPRLDYTEKEFSELLQSVTDKIEVNISNLKHRQGCGIMPVYEDGYGDDGCPVYLCPACYKLVYEHQEVCQACKQEITWK